MTKNLLIVFSMFIGFSAWAEEVCVINYPDGRIFAGMNQSKFRAMEMAETKCLNAGNTKARYCQNRAVCESDSRRPHKRPGHHEEGRRPSHRWPGHESQPENPYGRDRFDNDNVNQGYQRAWKCTTHAGDGKLSDSTRVDKREAEDNAIEYCQNRHGGIAPDCYRNVTCEPSWKEIK